MVAWGAVAATVWGRRTVGLSDCRIVGLSAIFMLRADAQLGCRLFDCFEARPVAFFKIRRSSSPQHRHPMTPTLCLGHLSR